MATDPRRLAFLLAVKRAGGVLAAAQLLGVTPSAVSQQIARLEAEEGFPVLDRGPRGVTLTRAGRVLASAGERIEAELVAASQAIQALGDGVVGHVGIGSFQTAIRSLVVPSLARLNAAFPEVEIDIREDEPEESLRELRTGTVDLVIFERDTEVPVETPAGSADITLAEEPWRLVMPADWETPSTLADLAHITLLGGAPETAHVRALGRIAKQLGTDLTIRHHFYDFDTALSMVAGGQGAALISSLGLVGGNLEGVKVVALEGLGTRTLTVRHRSTRFEPGVAVRAVIDALLETASDLEFA